MCSLITERHTFIGPVTEEEADSYAMFLSQYGDVVPDDYVPTSMRDKDDDGDSKGQLPFGLDCAGIKAILTGNDILGTVGGWVSDLFGFEGSFSISPSVDGLFGIPLRRDLSGKGVSVDVGVGLSFDIRDPLNFALSVHDNISIMDTIGAGGFLTIGPAVGVLRTPDSGFQESGYSTSRGAVGWGFAVSGSVDLYSNYMNGSVTGGSGSFGSGGLGGGFGVVVGVSDSSPELQIPAYSFSTGNLNAKTSLKAYYEEHCQ